MHSREEAMERIKSDPITKKLDKKIHTDENCRRTYYALIQHLSYHATDISGKMLEHLMQVHNIVAPYGFIVDIDFDYDGYPHGTETGPQMQILNEDKGHLVKLALWDDGLIHIDEFLDNGDIVEHQTRSSFSFAAKYAITLFKQQALLPNYGN